MCLGRRAAGGRGAAEDTSGCECIEAGRVSHETFTTVEWGSRKIICNAGMFIWQGSPTFFYGGPN